MPRPSKAIKRQRVNAASEYKKGKRKEAYGLWAAAEKARLEIKAKKKAKKAASKT